MFSYKIPRGYKFLEIFEKRTSSRICQRQNRKHKLPSLSQSKRESPPTALSGLEFFKGPKKRPKKHLTFNFCRGELHEAFPKEQTW